MPKFVDDITDHTIFGDRRVTYGTFVISGGVGGQIDTGLKKCQNISFTPYYNERIAEISVAGIISGAVVAVSGSTVMPVSGGLIDIIANDYVSGTWLAFGK